MTRLLWINAALLIGLVACEQGEDLRPLQPTGQGTCEVHINPICEASQGDQWMEDGAVVAYGNPPQGGAPYAPFTLRFEGIEQGETGLNISIEALDALTGEVLGTTDYQQWLTCANVGDSQGYLVGPEFHLRFFGLALEDLEGREAEFTVTATNEFGQSVSMIFFGELSWTL